MVVLAAIVAAVAVWVAHTSGNTRRARRSTPGLLIFPQPNGTFSVMGGGVASKVSFGMKPAEVRRRLGTPARTVRDRNGSTCWQYEENLKAGSPEDSVTHTLNATRICFAGGQYAIEYDQIDGRWSD